jgi:molybdopterin-containing oxidoreductase family iron-sulfur binding subunit
MAPSVKYWKGEDELLRDQAFTTSQKNEFAEDLPLQEVLEESNFELNSSRRDFLKYFGFSVTAVTLASCFKAPIRNAVPYLVKPEEITPGVPLYYSSTCGACATACGVEVKTREGRPIKLDGNSRSLVSNGNDRSPEAKGSLCAVGQASILSLYDNERLANPLKKGSESDWTTIDAEISKSLNDLAAAGSGIAIVSGSNHSPSTLKTIADFTGKYPTARHIMWDSVSYSGILEANETDFGKKLIPSYYFDKAQVIVSFGADFLGTWISPVEFTKSYVRNRVPAQGKEMSKHIQFESNLSLTGTNADDRFPMKSGNEGIYLAALYNKIAQAKGGKQIPVATSGELAGNSIAQTAEMLLKNAGKSLVISGSNDAKLQMIVNGINMMLGNYGQTIDLDNHSNQFKAVDRDMDTLLADINSGKVSGVIFYNVNPVYSHHQGKAIKEAIGKLKLSVSTASSKDETASACAYVCPDNHFLESWSDAEPKAGQFHFTQPVISPVFNTRQAQLSLLSWSVGVLSPEKDPMADKQIMNQRFQTSPFYTYMQTVWQEKLGAENFQTRFNQCLHDGVLTSEPKATVVPAYASDLTAIGSYLDSTVSKEGQIDLVLYQKVGLRDGSMANNPWLHELPDPMSKVCWDNYVTLPKSLAVSKGIELGDTVNIKAGGITLNNVPVIIQPGQANGTIGLALGYGRTAAGKVGGSTEKAVDTVGVNAYPMFQGTSSSRSFVVRGVEVSKGDGTYALAQTQTHHTIEGRNHVREATFTDWKKNPKAGNDEPKPHMYTVWQTPEYRRKGATGHLWAMAIDLNACTGCGSCVVSCSIENNVPIVGRKEIILRREMTWLRIDRYYSFSNDGTVIKKENEHYEGAYLTKEKGLEALDKELSNKQGAAYAHYEHVKVVHQPMMCQHCGQAPCETVCPVLATTHSTEGINQMTYNRCIGTKYCGNNCPYKVRRFNWYRYNNNSNFDYHFNNELGKMVINPDVTVRTRGVMEKCSFCIQKVQEGKLRAKREKRSLNDGEVKTACQRACPANAIVFGDLNDEQSEITKLYRNERGFHVLEELNVQSSVKYLTKIRNTETV